MGHEATGVVHSVGTAVTTLKEGDRVAIEPGFPCRRCKTCKDGHYNLCAKMAFAASPPSSHGALTKYYKIPEDFCYKLPESMGLDEGALVEPLAVAVHIVRLANVQVGQDVVVFGAGTIGLLCAAVSKAFGAKNITSVDINDERLHFAKNFAATGTFRPGATSSVEENARSIIEQCSLGDGADVVLEATGAEPCIEMGINVLRPGGTFVQAGLGKAKIQFPVVMMSEKELTIRGCFRYSSGDYNTTMHLLTAGKVSVKELITGIEPFNRATEAWERTKRGDGIKTLIHGPE
jgi:D-xylulose reductase